MHATLYNKDDIVIDRTLFIRFLILFLSLVESTKIMYTPV